MNWVLIAISGYFFSAIAALFDKYLLVGPIPNPKVYSFYVGALGILALILVPLGFTVPDPWLIILSLLSGALFVFSLFWYCQGLRFFEASRIVPVIGGLNPIFVFVLTFFIGEKIFGPREGIAFFLLIAGTIFITVQNVLFLGKRNFREKLITFKSFQISAMAAFLFSISFFLAKIVYSEMPFWSGFIWMRLGGFLAALFFLFYKEVREELFRRKTSFKPKTTGIFFLAQTLGASSAILQNFAIALVPFGFLPFVSALEGIKYLFVLILAILLSLKFPQLLKEEISKKVVFQKIFAVLLFGAGLAILALK